MCHFFLSPLTSLCKCHFGIVFCDSINLVIKALQIEKSYLLKAVPAVYPRYSLLTMLVAVYQKHEDRKDSPVLSIWCMLHYHHSGLHLDLKIIETRA